MNTFSFFFLFKRTISFFVGRIERRLDLVETFVNDVHLRQTITEDHLRRMPDFQRIAKKLQKSRAKLIDLYKYFMHLFFFLISIKVYIDFLYRIHCGLVRLPKLVELLSEHEGPHSAVILPVLIQPLRDANEKLFKLKELIETTIDISRAESTGDCTIKANFDEELGGK